MGLCLKMFSISVLLAAATLSPSTAAPETRQPQLQADLCELLRDEQEDLLNEYPNEYYDCHAHSRYLKLSSLNKTEPKAS